MFASEISPISAKLAARRSARFTAAASASSRSAVRGVVQHRRRGGRDRDCEEGGEREEAPYRKGEPRPPGSTCLFRRRLLSGHRPERPRFPMCASGRIPNRRQPRRSAQVNLCPFRERLHPALPASGRIRPFSPDAGPASITCSARTTRSAPCRRGGIKMCRIAADGGRLDPPVHSLPRGRTGSSRAFNTGAAGLGPTAESDVRTLPCGRVYRRRTRRMVGRTVCGGHAPPEIVYSGIGRIGWHQIG